MEFLPAGSRVFQASHVGGPDVRVAVLLMHSTGSPVPKKVCRGDDYLTSTRRREEET